MVDLMLKRLVGQLEGQGLGIEVTQAAKEELATIGYDPQLGARPLRRAIQRQIEDILSEKILYKTFSAGEIIVVDVEPDPETRRQAALHVHRRRRVRPAGIGRARHHGHQRGRPARTSHGRMIRRAMCPTHRAQCPPTRPPRLRRWGVVSPIRRLLLVARLRCRRQRLPPRRRRRRRDAERRHRRRHDRRGRRRRARAPGCRTSSPTCGSRTRSTTAGSIDGPTRQDSGGLTIHLTHEFHSADELAIGPELDRATAHQHAGRPHDRTRRHAGRRSRRDDERDRRPARPRRRLRSFADAACSRPSAGSRSATSSRPAASPPTRPMSFTFRVALPARWCRRKRAPKWATA